MPPERAPAIVGQSELSETQDRQRAYRIRSEFDAALNSKSGWAEAMNTPATVLADQPFRLRLEIEARPGAVQPRRYELQFRRNQGAWESLLAENFPQPVKEFVLEFEDEPAAPLSDTWSIAAGQSGAINWQLSNGAGFLNIQGNEGPLIATGQFSFNWEPVECAVVLRLPGDPGSRAGLVFDFTDNRNYQRVEVEPGGLLSHVKIENSKETVVSSFEAKSPLHGDFELKLIQEDGSLVVEMNDAVWSLGEDASAHSLAPLGLFVSEGSEAQLKSFAVEGLPRSPRTSIIASDSFSHGEDTQDVLQGSELPFSGGAGISFAKQTPVWSAGDGHGEWEFPIVIRYFSDGAVVNEAGDVFEYRLLDAAGNPLRTDHYAKVTLEVADGHLGGTFVETPMRIGPWQASDGSLYFLMEPAETWNSLMALKSENGGRSWREAGGDSRPETGDLEGFASRLMGDQIHMLHQTSDAVFYHVFRTADHPAHADTWMIRDEWVASPEEPPTQVADLAVRSDGSVVAVYGGPEKIHRRIRSSAGLWGDDSIIDSETAPNLSGPSLVVGQNDAVHLAYTGSDGSGWYRRILTDDSMTERVKFSSELGMQGDDVGSILPLVYSETSGQLSILYRSAEGFLWERRVGPEGEWTEAMRVSDRPVVQNAVDSEQTGADAIAFKDSVHVLFIEESTGHLYHTARKGSSAWSGPELLVDDQNAQWVRGLVVHDPDGRAVYAYVFDGGADGGSGKNQFGQIPLEAE